VLERQKTWNVLSNKVTARRLLVLEITSAQIQVSTYTKSIGNKGL